MFSSWRVLSVIALQDWSSRDVGSDMIRRDVM